LAAAPRIAFITNTPLIETATGLSSSLASVRREIILPARGLNQRGVATHIISLRTWPLEEARKIVAKADRVVFGKLWTSADEAPQSMYEEDANAYRAVISEGIASGRTVFCLSDDHFDASHFSAFYKEVATTSRVWLASSEALKERLQRQTACPVLAYPEVTESATGVARTPRRGLRTRLGMWIARRSRVGMDPWRLKLLWFGHPTNVPSLVHVLPELERFAEHVPVWLECVTQRGAPVDARAAATSSSTPLRITVSPWSLEYMSSAFEACDAVLLPQSAEDPAKRAKSNNRMVDALQAGRFVIAHPIPSYEELRDYSWVGESITLGLDWLIRHPAAALRKIVAGQQYLAKYHSLEALTAFWLRALELESAFLAHSTS
jgi:hypothetical protein